MADLLDQIDQELTQHNQEQAVAAAASAAAAENVQKLRQEQLEQRRAVTLRTFFTKIRPEIQEEQHEAAKRP